MYELEILNLPEPQAHDKRQDSHKGDWQGDKKNVLPKATGGTSKVFLYLGVQNREQVLIASVCVITARDVLWELMFD